jgi:hypothetical protein
LVCIASGLGIGFRVTPERRRKPKELNQTPLTPHDFAWLELPVTLRKRRKKEKEEERLKTQQVLSLSSIPLIKSKA